MTDKSLPGKRMKACLGMADLTYGERNILAAIAYYDGPGGAWPSIQTIADDLQVKPWKVNRWIKSLKEKGRLEVQRGQTVNRYKIHYSGPVSPGLDCQSFSDSENES